jgi:hypothetical protein
MCRSADDISSLNPAFIARQLLEEDPGHSQSMPPTEFM